VDEAGSKGYQIDLVSDAPAPSRRLGRYHHGSLPAALVDAARDIIDQAGPKGLTMRAVAQRVGVTHAAPYRHFADKAALLAAAGREELALLTELLREKRRAGLHGMGRSYLHHGQQHAALYRCAFGHQPQQAADRQPSTVSVIVKELASALREHLKTPIDAGELERSALYLWAGWHGATLLAISGTLPFTGTAVVEAEQLIELHCTSISERLRRGSYAREDVPARH